MEPTLDRLLDNGTHMVVGANRAVFDYLTRIGASDGLVAGPDNFPMHDLATGKTSATLSVATGCSVLAALWTLGRCGTDATVADCVGGSAQFRRFWDPLAIAIMNTPAEAAAATVFRRVAQRTLWRSRAASRPYLARHGLSETFVRPALARLAALGVQIRLNRALRGLPLDNGRASALLFDDTRISLEDGDAVILAVPWTIARSFLPALPELPASPIINGHFRLAEPPESLPDGGFLGLLGGTGQWLFRRGDVISVTVSAAGGLVEHSADALTDALWTDVARALDLRTAPLACRIIKEKRATLFHTPDVEQRRPPPRVADNLHLAGDWTATGLPCTLEGAIVSGRTAARLAIGT
jgi:hypothetical protein